VQVKTEAEVQAKILEAGITLTVINNFETKIYNPQPAPEPQPKLESKPALASNLLPQSFAETLQPVAAPRAKKARVAKGPKRKKKSSRTR
jgi:hypothetical protein